MSILKVDTLQPATASNVNIAGHVVQVVQGTLGSAANTNTTSYSDTGLTATITPTSATSKILVLCNMCASGVMQNGGADAQGLFKLVRGSTDLNEAVNRSYDYGGSGSIIFGQFLMSWSDSPSTTSATTYKLQQKCTVGTNVRICEGSVSSIMHLMEIAQ